MNVVAGLPDALIGSRFGYTGYPCSSMTTGGYDAHTPSIGGAAEHR